MYFNMLCVQPTGRSDPYVVVTCGESYQATSWKLQTLEPEWNETLRLWVPKGDAKANRLCFRVRDKDFLSSDDDLGVVYVTLMQLNPLKEVELELELMGPTAGLGALSVSCTLLPFRSDSPGMAPGLL
jgi:Ca2+-dependent lipid-binding protein